MTSNVSNAPQPGNLGPSGVQSRIRELQGRIARLSPPRSPAESFESSLGSGLTGDLNAGAAGFRPMNPMSPGLEVSIVGAPDSLQTMIAQAAERHGLDPAVLEALVWAESSFNPAARSPKGAMGLTQLMPATARSLGVTDPFDPAQNLEGGAKYLAQMLKQFNGDIRLALAGYNAGPGKVRQHGGVPPYRETQAYIDKILTRAGVQP